jgi:hypothetical protein
MMLKIDPATLDEMERQHPGIRATIRRFEKRPLPACPRCGSANTADVQCGVVGRTIYLAAATTKFKLIPNGPKPGKYFCNGCREFFD